MSRRLNQEAAKAVKYGGVSEEDAWKFVTLNPAKMLHIDDKVGKHKDWKNADLVVWDNHPLSIYAKEKKQLSMVSCTTMLLNWTLPYKCSRKKKNNSFNK